MRRRRPSVGLADARAQVVGLRYFNVYGPGEAHKGSMASVAFHLQRPSRRNEGEARLFEGSDGYAAGEQRRDFVYVDDVVDVNLWFYDQRHVSGVFNVGTGASATFNDVARAIIAWHGKGAIRYIPFPGRAQVALSELHRSRHRRPARGRLRAPFHDVRAGVKGYLGRARSLVSARRTRC